MTGCEAIPACLSVIIPIYNEETTIDEIISRVLSQRVVDEVIVVDDGSTDNSWARLKSWPYRDPRVSVFCHENNRGKGAALRTGFSHVRSQIVVVQDGDLEYDPSDFTRMLALIWAGDADVVYGTRFSNLRPPSEPLWHYVGNKFLTIITNCVTKLNLTDEATCYKMFRRDLLTRITLEEEGFGFCPEFTAKISKLNVRIREIPISYQGRNRKEGKKIRLRHGFEALFCIIKYVYFS